MKASFTFEQDIAVIADGVYHDLHNCFDFVGFEYRPEAQAAWLEWCKNDGHWVPDDAPQKIKLYFDGVTALVMTRRDPKMPFSEDTCVELITFAPESCADVFDAGFDGARFPDEHLSLLFMSGAGLKIWAESVRHEIQGTPAKAPTSSTEPEGRRS